MIDDYHGIMGMSEEVSDEAFDPIEAGEGGRDRRRSRARKRGGALLQLEK